MGCLCKPSKHGCLDGSLLPYQLTNRLFSYYIGVFPIFVHFSRYMGGFWPRFGQDMRSHYYGRRGVQWIRLEHNTTGRRMAHLGSV